jgi:peptidyl-prolyl cis-trans isomerase SurA
MQLVAIPAFPGMWGMLPSPLLSPMKTRSFRSFAALFCGAVLMAASAGAQTPANQPESPYGGSTVEDIIARVNDQIISKTDYDRALLQLDEEGRQRGATRQEISEVHKDLLRNLIDQQLWLSKGKELGITGDTELVQRLNEIRKQYNMTSLEDLEQAAKEQGVSFEDFKQNIRNQIVTQTVMRQQVGSKIQFTPGEAMQYYEEHKQDFSSPESVRLAEIRIATPEGSDQAAIEAAKAKAEDVEARLHSGGDFAQLAKSFSDGPTAAQGGDLGQFKRGALAKVLEDKTFALESGQWTDPIQTRQGWVILKVVQHVPGGAAPFKDVESQVDEALYMGRMEPAIRQYLTTMREQAFIDIKAGYVDTGASPNETKPIFSAYVPPAPKKKEKVERTRYRENARGYRQTAATTPAPAATPAGASAVPAAQPGTKTTVTVTAKTVAPSAQKPGKKEKIRFGQAPRATLPTAAKASETVDAGALPPTETAAANEPANPLEAAPVTTKSRYSARAKAPKADKPQSIFAQQQKAAPAPPDTGEVADRSTQSTPLGLNGDTSSTKKKEPAAATTGEKTRYSDRKEEKPQQPVQMTPTPQVQGAPAPATAPKTPAPQGEPTPPAQPQQ